VQKRILPPTYLLVAVALAAALHFLLPVAVIILFPWRLAGVLPLAVGIALNLAADRQFKQRGTTVKPFQESSALIMDGCFRFSRNPMYLGMVLIVAGIAIFAGTASPWIVIAGLAVVLDRVFIAPEERMMEHTFGDAFRQYKSRVRRWL
jgi:protein-S-isoprenylcysteine O-methyltransferase Ste14